MCADAFKNVGRNDYYEGGLYLHLMNRKIGQKIISTVLAVVLILLLFTPFYHSSIIKEKNVGNPPGWTDDIRISNNITLEWDDEPVISANGNKLHIVWKNTQTGKQEIFYTNSTDCGQTWSNFQQLSLGDPIDSKRPDIGISNDNLHVVWDDTGGIATYEIRYINSTDGGETWNPSKLISVDDGDNSEAPRTAVNNSCIHVIWIDARFGLGLHEVYYKRSIDGGITWDDALGANVDRRITHDLSDTNDIDIGINGSNLHVLFGDNRDGSADVYYIRSIDNGVTWDNGTTVDEERKLTSNNTAHADNAIAVNGSTIHVAWVDETPGPNYYIYYRNSTDNGANWNTIQQLTGPSPGIAYVDLAVSGDDVHAIWADTNGVTSSEIYYINSTDGGATWDSEILLTSDDGQISNMPKIAVENEKIHVTWRDNRDGNPEIYYKRFPDYPAVDTTPPDINHIPVTSANISQSINITANITDDVSVGAVYLNYTGVNTTNYNVSMTQWNGNWSYDIPGQDNIGFVDYFIWCNDTSGNVNMTGINQTQINDVTDPEINHFPVVSANVFDPINITANITDDVSVNQVYLDYTGVNTTNYNVSMNKWNGNWSFDIPGQAFTGTVDYFIWANDTSDNDNMTGNYSIQIYDPENPVADAGLDQSVDEDEEVYFDGSGSSDNVGIEWYNWSFGDGSYSNGIDNINPSHVYADAGTYIVTLNVSDAAGNWDTDTCLIFVNNVGPTADAGNNQVVEEGETVLFDGGGSNDTSSDLPNLTYTWYFGDGDSDTGISVTHVYEDNGTYTATLIVTDDNGFVDSDTSVITVNNIAPVIEPVSTQTILEDSLFTLKINATDVPADTLTFSDNTTLFDINPITGMIEFTPTNDDVGNHSVNITVVDDDGGVNYTILNITVENTNDQPTIETISQQSAIEDEEFTLQVNADDVDVADVLTYSLTSYPSGMNIDDTTGLISWTPTNDDVGTHTITVKVEDSIGTFYTETFTIIVSNVNDAPTIVTNSLANATEDMFYIAFIQAEDVDIGDSLTYSLDSYPAFLSINPLTGMIFGTPDNDNVGTHNIVVNVTDGDTYVAKTFSLTVVNVNDAPVIASSPILTADVGVKYAYDIIASDEDNDVLTYTLSEGPEGMVINGSKIVWTPTEEQQGKTYQVVVEVTDGEITTTQSFVVSVGEIPEGTNVWLALLMGLVGGLISGIIITWIMNQRKKEGTEECDGSF